MPNPTIDELTRSRTEWEATRQQQEVERRENIKKLNRTERELLAQLEQIRAMREWWNNPQASAGGPAPTTPKAAPAAPPPPAAAAAAPPPPPAAPAAPDLKAYILAALEQAGTLDVPSLQEAVLAAGFTTDEPAKLRKRIEGHLGNLKRSNLVVVNEDRTYSPPGARKASAAAVPAAPAAAPTNGKASAKTEKVSIPGMIRTVLSNAKGKEMTISEISDAILARGYKTEAKDFRSNVKSALSKMKGKEVVHVKNKGYRLKKK